MQNGTTNNYNRMEQNIINSDVLLRLISYIKTSSTSTVDIGATEEAVFICLLLSKTTEIEPQYRQASIKELAKLSGFTEIKLRLIMQSLWERQLIDFAISPNNTFAFKLTQLHEYLKQVTSNTIKPFEAVSAILDFEKLAALRKRCKSFKIAIQFLFMLENADDTGVISFHTAQFLKAWFPDNLNIPNTKSAFRRSLPIKWMEGLGKNTVTIDLKQAKELV